jgi:hypothetical protein
VNIYNIKRHLVEMEAREGRVKEVVATLLFARVALAHDVMWSHESVTIVEEQVDEFIVVEMCCQHQARDVRAERARVYLSYQNRGSRVKGSRSVKKLQYCSCKISLLAGLRFN